FSSVSETRWPLLAFFCKMNSTSRQHNATIALLYSLFLLGFMLCLSQVACIFSSVACFVSGEELSKASQILSCYAEMVYCMHGLLVYADTTQA
ncbi:hypothetical protein DY000_02031805, partial [Brassica cretica]